MDDRQQPAPLPGDGTPGMPRRPLGGHALAWISLVCGVLAMPAMLVPGLGFLLGTAAVVSGCKALARLSGQARFWFGFGVEMPILLTLSMFTTPRGRALLGFCLGLIGAPFNIIISYLIAEHYW